MEGQPAGNIGNMLNSCTEQDCTMGTTAGISAVSPISEFCDAELRSNQVALMSGEDLEALTCRERETQTSESNVVDHTLSICCSIA